MSVDGINLSGGFGKPTVNSKDKKNKDNDFNALLNLSIDKRDNDYFEGVVKHEVGRTDTRKYAIRNPEAKNRFDFNSYAANKVIKKVDDSEVSIENIEENAVLLQNIKQELIDIFGITDQQFDDALEELNLTINDLLDFNNIKNIILNVYNADESEPLVNAELDNLIKNAIERTEEVIQSNKQSGEVFEPLVSNEDFDKAVDVSIAVNEFADNASPETVDIAKDTSSVLPVEQPVSDENVNITVNTETSSSDNLSRGDTKESRNTVEQILTNINQAIENVADENIIKETPVYVDSMQELDIIQQIIEDIHVNLSKESTSMEMQLNPENLGKVHISVVEKNGVMQAQITTETEAAKHAIETNLILLKENFQNQELKVDAIEVMVANYEFFNQSKNNDNTGGEETLNSSKRMALNISDKLSVDKPDEREELEVKMMKENGNSISYLA